MPAVSRLIGFDFFDNLGSSFLGFSWHGANCEVNIRAVALLAQGARFGVVLRHDLAVLYPDDRVGHRKHKIRPVSVL